MKLLMNLLALLLLTTGTSLCQDYKLTDFVETKAPKVGSDEWYKLNHSDHEFKVSTDHGTIKIGEAHENQTATLEIESGQFTGTDRGEWGGKIEFIEKGATDKRLIKEGNVKFIFRYKSEIYFIEGLAHMGIDTGAMYRLDNVKGSFVPVKIMDFESAPETMAIVGDKIFVVSHEFLFIVRNSNKEIIFMDAFWAGLYPNSIVALDDQNIYIGHRGGYSRVDIINKRIRFFKFRRKG